MNTIAEQSGWCFCFGAAQNIFVAYTQKKFKGATMPKDRISLQILFNELPKFSAKDLSETAANVSHRAPAFNFQLPQDTSVDGNGLAATDTYKIKIEFCNRKLSDVELAQISAHVRLVPDCDEGINQHGAYIELSVDPNQDKPLEAYQLLTFLAFLIARHGGLVIANINGFTSFSAPGLQQIMADEDWMDAIENMPPLFLYSGPVIHEFDGNELLWMRSYGNHLLGISDLGTAFSNHIVQQYVPMTLTVFDNIMSYMMESGNKVEAGHTMESESVMIALQEQKAEPDEYFYQSPSGLLNVVYTPKAGVKLPNF